VAHNARACPPSRRCRTLRLVDNCVPAPVPCDELRRVEIYCPQPSSTSHSAVYMCKGRSEFGGEFGVSFFLQSTA
jgi:hypothetical protein